MADEFRSPAHNRVVPVTNTAEGLLELLRAHGVECFFGVGGTDFPPLIEAFAKSAAQGRATPRPISVPHEFPAISMAHGYAMVTGHPQAVMVHVTVGTLNAASGVMNACRLKVPLLFLAGRTPITEEGAVGSRSIYIHWGQESFDQGALVREHVKWDYELRTPAQLETVVNRAMAMATAEPPGPVYLTLPREVLMAPLAEVNLASVGRCRVDSLVYPDPDRVAEAAQILAAAEYPVILTTSAGRHAETVEPLVRLAETGAMAVVESFAKYMNFPRTHPLHLGFDPKPQVERADALLLVESEVPWYPSKTTLPQHTRVIHLAVDPLFTRIPIRGFPIDVPIAADPRTALPLLTGALAARVRAMGARLEARAARIRREHDEQRASWKAAARSQQHRASIGFEWLSACVDQVLGDDAILINEYDCLPQQLTKIRPGGFFMCSSASGLGWGLGAAIGAKLARPEKTVIATLGDGSYNFSVPTACHYVAQRERAPILVVLFDNRGWNAVKRETRSLYPEGWAARTQYFPFTEIDPAPAYHTLMEACGGYGVRVEHPDELPAALEEALRVVKEQERQALVHVVCEHI